jgi:hypothetical protein
LSNEEFQPHVMQNKNTEGYVTFLLTFIRFRVASFAVQGICETPRRSALVTYAIRYLSLTVTNLFTWVAEEISGVYFYCLGSHAI